MKKACVIGWPIEHSRSPLIHGYWLKRYGIEGTYTKVPVRSEDLRSFLQDLRSHGYAGCNVTVPHKEAAFAIASRKEASAIAVGAANTLWVEGETLVGANTDTYGFMTHLASRYPDWAKPDRPVSILGAGGAARAVVYGFLEAGVHDIRIFNRSQERARALASHFGSRVTTGDWDSRSSGSNRSSVVVNTTSVGMKGAGSLALACGELPKDCVVADIVYVPLETELLKEAKACGLRTLDGLGMLLHQAVPGFEKWFGLRPEVTRELYDLVAADIENR